MSVLKANDRLEFVRLAMLIEMLRKLDNPETSQLRTIYDKYAIAALVFKDENAHLHRSGRGQATVDGALENPWLRYRMDKLQILIVEK